MKETFKIPSGYEPDETIVEKANAFLEAFNPFEKKNGVPLVLHFDAKSQAYYFVCHLDKDTLISNADLDAGLDADDEDEIYKLNRDVTEDKAAFFAMKEDAGKGRSFEDLVVEFDSTYNAKKPLKIYGGQHRIRALEESGAKDVVHGTRVYFGLSRDQKVEIAIINNTSIAVPNDLLDRMREQLLGTELRDWCQKVGLLASGEDFADRKSPDVPTVRIARTLIVNYFKGLGAKNDDFHQPVVCRSGGTDEEYNDLRKNINWNDAGLIRMGKEFARLHQLQRERVLKRKTDNYAEYARKALSITVVASWAYASGFFQQNGDFLKHHYALPDSVGEPDDPLNAKALSHARLKGVDPDTYRGLGTRIGPKELGRMLEVFLVHAAKASVKRINKELANAAIQSYEAKKATYEANKVLGKI